MKFACVEYVTKSGRIWRPTPERPNYLCNPWTEIDPTSYGCWTSALNGEHLPIHWVALGQEDGDPGFQWAKRWWRLRRKITGQTSYRNLEAMRQYDVVLVVIHADPHSTLLMTDFLRQAKQMATKTIFIGTLGDCLEPFRSRWRDPALLQAFCRFFDACDLFVSWHREMVGYLQLFGSTPVVYFSEFYPVEYAREFSVSRLAKEPKIFAAGHIIRPDNVATFLVSRALQRQFPDYTIVVDQRVKDLAPLLRGCRVEHLPRLRWKDFLAAVGSMALVINLDVSWTRGRVPSDAAAVGTPCIGMNADFQAELFPSLTCRDVDGVERAIALGQRLLSDPSFYEETVALAQQRLSFYSYAHFRKRFETLVTLYQTGQLESWKELSYNSAGVHHK